MKPGFKQTDVGLIPEAWDVLPLGRLAHIERGKFTARPRNDPKFYGGNIPFIQTGDVTNTEGTISIYTQTLNSDGLKVSKLFPKGTLFFTIAANIGDVGVATFDAACPDSLVAIKPSANTDRRWLVYELARRKASFQRIATHNAQLNINLEKLRPYLLPHPPFAEQNAIADALSDTDAYIDSLRKLIAKKCDLKQATMQQLLSGKKRLARFKDGWAQKLLGDLFTFGGGYSASRAQLSSEGHRYLHYGDIHTSNKVLVDVDSDHGDLPRLRVPLSKVAPASLLCDGDVVFVDASEDAAGTSKHVVVKNEANLPFISGLHTIVAKRKTDELRREYLCHCFQTHEIRRQFLFYAVGTKVSGVSKGNIGKIELPVPSPAEQTAIAEVLSDMDSEIEALEDKLSKVRQIKQGMMQELLTGRIRLV